MTHTTPARGGIVVFALFLGGLLTGAVSGQAAANRAQDPYEDLDVFARVLTLIENDYVDEVDDDVLVSAALAGMVRELDPHSRWLSPEDYAALQDDTQGEYEGIGVEMRRGERGVVVARVIPESPAERDGIEAGDRVLAVDGKLLEGLSLDEVGALIQGERGASVRLMLERVGWPEPREITTIRDRIHLPSVETARLDGGLVYARLVQFQEGTAEDLEAKIRAEGGESGPSAIVLDLRDDPGGLLDEAVAVSDLFLDSGVIVSTKGRAEGEVRHEATVGGFPATVPVIVLVNGLSASASEIVAGALQDTHRAELVGTATYGKGSVQTVYENSDHSALKLTVGRYYTPSGAPVAAHKGREPDHVVDFPVEPSTRDRLRKRLSEVTLSEADRAELIALTDRLPVGEPGDPILPWDKPVAERLATDPQLAFAVDRARQLSARR